MDLPLCGTHECLALASVCSRLSYLYPSTQSLQVFCALFLFSCGNSVAAESGRLPSPGLAVGCASLQLGEHRPRLFPHL